MRTIAIAALLAAMTGVPALVLVPAATAQVSVGVGVGPGGVGASISVGTAPPPLPTYEQPLVPGPGYVWTPGYWAWSPAGYFYWVAGAWMLPPSPGLLWTPGWWGWGNGLYNWYPGYWAPEVGFYGGINYGYGYFGAGYSGGYWLNRQFYYNTAVSRVNVTNIHNTYVDKTVIRNVKVDHVSYNGGPGGVAARPGERDRAFENQHRVGATQAQISHRDQASRDPGQRYDTNRGRFGATPGAGGKPPAMVGAGARQPHGAQGPAQSGGRALAGPHPGTGVGTPASRTMGGRQDSAPGSRAGDAQGHQPMPEVQRGGRQQAAPSTTRTQTPTGQSQRIESQSRSSMPQPPRMESQPRPSMQPPRVESQPRSSMQQPQRIESRPRSPMPQPQRIERQPRQQMQQPRMHSEAYQQPRFESRARSGAAEGSRAYRGGRNAHGHQ